MRPTPLTFTFSRSWGVAVAIAKPAAPGFSLAQLQGG